MNKDYSIEKLRRVGHRNNSNMVS